jgi:RNA polymerase sigma-70 factor (ECF subfamily)
VNTIEPDLIDQVQKGNPEAFTRLVEAYQRPVYNMCFRMLGDANDAEDAAQETFLKVYKNMKHYDHLRPFSTWLLSIAAHLCIDQLRKRRMVMVSIDAFPNIDPPDSSPEPEAVVRLLEDQKKVNKLLEILQPQDKAAIVMYYWYDFSYEEIANSLSLSVSAVKSRLHRAKLALVQSWQKQASTDYLVERKAHESPAF